MHRSLTLSLLLAPCLLRPAYAQPAEAAPIDAPPVAATPESTVPTSPAESASEEAALPIVHVVLHSRLSDEQRAALQESLSWQLQSLNVRFDFKTVTWASPTHQRGGLATIWIAVDGEDWKLYAFDGRDSYLRVIERADRDAAVIEAVAVIVQRSVAAIYQGEAPQLERVVPKPVVLAPTPPLPPKRPAAEPDTSPRWRLSLGYQLSDFAPEASPVHGPSVAVQVSLRRGFGVRGALTHVWKAQVDGDQGSLRLYREAAAIELGYWHEGRAFDLAAFAGAAVEFWTREAVAKRAGVVATDDTHHIVWAPSATLTAAWVPDRNISPYLALGVSAPLGAPKFSASRPGQSLLSPRAFRLGAEAGLSFRFH